MGWGLHGEISTLMRPAARAAHTPPEDLAKMAASESREGVPPEPHSAGPLTAYSQAPDL